MSEPSLMVVIDGEAGGLFSILSKVAQGLEKLQTTAASSSDSARGSLNRLENQAGTLSGAIFKGVAAFEALKGVFIGLQSVLERTLNADLALERAQRTLEMATGDGATSMAFVKKLAGELGLELVTTAEGYAMMTASAKGTSMEGRATEQVFTAVARATAAMSLSADQTHGVLLALSQMISKGKVQSEELRRQLAEHLPGAFFIAARAMGVTTGELDNMLRKGEVVASTFLPKFAAELERTMGDAPERAAQSLQGNINRMVTSLQTLAYEVGQGGGSAGLSATLGGLANKLNSAEATNAAADFGQTLGTVLTVAKNLAVTLWELRDPLMAIADAWVAMKVLQIGAEIVAWGRAKVALVTQTIATRNAILLEEEAIIRDSLALAGQTYIVKENALAQIQDAQAITLKTSLSLEEMVATGAMTEAEAVATRASLALANAKLEEAAAVATASAAGKAYVATSLLAGNWITLVAVAIGGLIYLWTQLSHSEEQAAANLKKYRDAELSSIQNFADLSREVTELSDSLKSGKLSKDEAALATQRMSHMIAKLVEQYPDLIKFMTDEKGQARDIATALKMANDERERTVRLEYETAVATQATLEGLVAKRKQWIEQREKSLNNWTFTGDDSQRNFRQESSTLEWDKEQLAIDEDMLKRQGSIVDTASAKWEALAKIKQTALAGGRGTDGGGNDDKTKDRVTHAEHLVRLAKLEAEAAEKRTLAEQEESEILAAQAELKERVQKLADEKAKGKFARPDGQGDYEQELKAYQTNYLLKHDQIMESYAEKRKAREGELQSNLVAQEEGGLDKRMAAIDKFFADFRKKNDETAIDSKPLLTEEQIISAETAARTRAREEQIREDIGKLKRELADLSQFQGGALSIDEMNRALAEFSRRSPEAAEAAKRLRAELQLDATAQAGWTSGMKQYITESKNGFKTWKQSALQTCQGVEGVFSSTFTGILTGQTKLFNGMKSIWKGITQVVAQALSQIAAKWLTAAIAQAIFGKTQAATALTEAEAAEATAAAEYFAAYAYIPFGGQALSLASIAIMEGVMTGMKAKALTGAVANAQGSLVTGPTLAFLGEAGQNEVVAPETIFRDWAGDLTRNILRQERQSLDYQRLGASYTQQARESAGGGRPLYMDLRGAVIAGESAESSRRLGKLVHKQVVAYDRSHG